MAGSFITLAEAESLTGISQEAWKKRCQAKQVEGAIKKGRVWLIPLASVGKEKPKAGVYIDGSNVYCGGKDLGWKVDYTKLREFIERKYIISIMSYYNCTGYLQDENGKYQKNENGKYILDPGALRFENSLRGMGIRVITKPLKFILGDEKKPSNKTDGDLMIDALMEHSQWDELLLLAGDCDYEKLVKQIVSMSKPVHIFSFNIRMSHELRILALQSPFVTFTKLEDLESIIKYEFPSNLTRRLKQQ